MARNWVVGFTIPLKTKVVLFLASLFALICFGLVGYKLGIYYLVVVSVILCILAWIAAFFKTWLCVDEVKKIIIIKRRFFFTWERSYSYAGMCLYIDRKVDNSSTFEYAQYDRRSVTHDIYLVKSGSKRGDLVFSSNVEDDYFRVLEYLSEYIEVI